MRTTIPRAALERQTQPRHRPEYLAILASGDGDRELGFRTMASITSVCIGRSGR